MNKMFKKGLISLAAASLISSVAMASNTDYNATNAEANATKGDYAILLNGKSAKADSVFLYLNNDQTVPDANLTSGDKLFIDLPEGVSFATAPKVKSSSAIFKDTAGADTVDATATYYTKTDGTQRAYVTVEKNVTDANISIGFYDLNLQVADDYATTTKDLNVTFGSIYSDGTVKEMTSKPKVATVAKEIALYPVYEKNSTLVLTEDDLPNVKNLDVVNAADAAELTLLFNVTSDVKAGDVIDINLPSYATLLPSAAPTASVLTDAQSIDLADANATDLTVSSVTGVGDSNSTLRVTFGSDAKEGSQVKVVLKTSDINITSEQPTGTWLGATVDGNATLAQAISSFPLAKMMQPNAVPSVVDGQDQNVTRGAANGSYMNKIQLKESFVDDLDGSGFKITLLGGAKFDANNTTGSNYSVYTSTIKDATTLEINSTGITPTSQDTITLDFNITVPSDFVGDKVQATIEKVGTNNKVETKTLDVANVINPKVTVETNTTDLKIGKDTTRIFQLDINETYYGSLQVIDGANRVFVNAVNCVKSINEDDTNTSNNAQGTTNGLTLEDGVSISDTSYRYTISSESKAAGANTYVDLNITVDDTCGVGDPVQVKLVHEDGTDYGTVTLATIDNPAVASVAEVNATESGSTSVQTLGTFNVKETWADALQTGTFSVIAPEGIEFTSASVAGTGDIAAVSAGGLDNRVYTFSVTGSATETDQNITLKGYVTKDAALGLRDFDIVDYDATTATSGSETGIKPTTLKLTYVSADGTYPALSVDKSEVDVAAGAETTVTLSNVVGNVTGSGDNPAITVSSVDGANVTIKVDDNATAGDTGTITFTDSITGKTATVKVTVAAAATPDPKTAVEDAIVAAGELAVDGYFTKYDFNGDGVQDYNDWAYQVASTGAVYQLLGNPSTDTDVFGWKAADVTVDSKDFYMTHYGTGKFDWVVYTPDCSMVYKLAGAADDGTFSYDVNGDGATDANDALDLTCTVSEDGKVTFSKK